MIDRSLPAIQRRLDHLLDGRLLGWTDEEQAEYRLLCASEMELLGAPARHYVAGVDDGWAKAMGTPPEAADR